jgi:hypothetical protein
MGIRLFDKCVELPQNIHINKQLTWQFEKSNSQILRNSFTRQIVNRIHIFLARYGLYGVKMHQRITTAGLYIISDILMDFILLTDTL